MTHRLVPALAGLAVGLAANAAHADSTVYPTGVFPDDAHHVQAAINQGGTVLLKATNTAGVPTAFNFGSSDGARGWVVVQSAVALVGETASNATTTIEGGWYPVRSFGSSSLAVRGVRFHASYDGSILAIADARTEVSNDRFEDLVGRPRDPSSSRTWLEVIVVFGGGGAIDDNVIDHANADFANGVSCGSSGALDVSRNHITGTSDAAIECGGPGAVTIADNVLRPGTSFSGFGGYGVELDGSGAFVVTGNDVVVNTPGGVGIWAFGANGFNFGATVAPVIQQNHVLVQPIGTLFGGVYTDGIDLAGLVSKAYIGQNIVEGTGFSAFSLYALAFDPSDPSDLGFNTLVGNDIANMHAWFADVVLDVPTHDTVLKGLSGRVLDLGTNNHVTGFSSQRGTGQQVSDAVSARNQANRDAAPGRALRPSPSAPSP
jgi:hypothetical protein